LRDFYKEFQFVRLPFRNRWYKGRGSYHGRANLRGREQKFGKFDNL